MEDKQLYEELKSLRLELRSAADKLRGIMDRASTVELSVAKKRGYNIKTKMGPNDPKVKHSMRRFAQHIGLSLNETNMAIARASNMMIDLAETTEDKKLMDLASIRFDVDNVFEDAPDTLFKQALLVLQSKADAEMYRGVEVCPVCNKAITLEHYTALSFEWTAGFQHAIVDHGVKAPAPFYKAVMDNFLKEFKGK